MRKVEIEENEDIFQKYVYKDGQEITFDVEFLYGVLNFCNQVIQSQPQVAVPMVYAESTNVITERDNPNEVVRVDTTWKNFPNVRSFMNTSFSEQGAVPIATLLSLMARQIEQALTDKHIENIQNGIAIENKNEQE